MKSALHIFVSLIGVVLAFCFLAASAAMNWRYGVSLGRTEFDQLTFGGVSVTADLFKASLPFFIFWSTNNRRLVVSFAACGLWLLCTAYSVTSGLGFAALNRGDTASFREDQIDQRTDIEHAQTNARERLKLLSAARPEATIEAEIEGLKTDKKWARTSQCKKATLNDSRVYCQQYHELQGELGTARVANNVRAKIIKLERRVTEMRKNGLQRDADPQANILSKLLQIDLSTVSMSLIVLVAILVEAGSGLGLFVALNHGGISETKRHMRNSEQKASDEGDIARYAVSRLRLAHGKDLEVSALYTDYRKWCSAKGYSATNKHIFETTFSTLCTVVGFDIAGMEPNRIIINMELDI